MGLKGYRLWGMGQLDSTCSAPPGFFIPEINIAILFSTRSLERHRARHERVTQNLREAIRVLPGRRRVIPLEVYQRRGVAA
jgi:hypothetical protein